MIHLTVSNIRAVLLDIEGTTTPISFVHDVLFPYARARLAEYLGAERESKDVAEVLRRFAQERTECLARGEAPPADGGPRRATSWLGSAVAFAEWLMDRDRKSPGLKLLQGLIWERGYRAGELRGIVFDDVPAAVRRWRAAGLRVAIYSSGSVLAQRRLFESTGHGDLTPQLSAFFDTAIGAKVEADSYRRIAEALALPASNILFLSDVTAELNAAHAAGLRVAMSRRAGNPPQAAHPFETLASFDEVVV